MNKKFTTAGVILTAGMLLAACGSDDSTTGSEGSETEGTGSDLNLVEEGKFTSASSGLYKPFNYEEGGNLTGFDIEIGNALAEEMGLEPNPVTTPWETIIQGLTTNRFDAILGSMAITEEREEQVSFSDPYYYSGGVIFVREGNTEIQSEAGWFIVAFVLHLILDAAFRYRKLHVQAEQAENRMVLLYVLMIAMFILLGAIGGLWLAALLTSALTAIIVFVAWKRRPQ